MLTRQDAINLLMAISGYMRNRQESPRAANDILEVVTELERLWKIEDAYNESVTFLYTHGLIKGENVNGQETLR